MFQSRLTLIYFFSLNIDFEMKLDEIKAHEKEETHFAMFVWYSTHSMLYVLFITKSSYNFLSFSVLQLEDCADEIDLNSAKSSSASIPSCKKTSPLEPFNKNGDIASGVIAGGAVTYSGTGVNRQRRGLLEGLWGCLRPVWTIIGKAAAAENKVVGK